MTHNTSTDDRSIRQALVRGTCAAIVAVACVCAALPASAADANEADAFMMVTGSNLTMPDGRTHYYSVIYSRVFHFKFSDPAKGWNDPGEAESVLSRRFCDALQAKYANLADMIGGDCFSKEPFASETSRADLSRARTDAIKSQDAGANQWQVGHIDIIEFNDFAH